MMEFFDVVEVAIAQPNTVRVIATGKTKANAEATSAMAVWRRGVEDHFFAEVPAGKFKDGDNYTA